MLMHRNMEPLIGIALIAILAGCLFPLAKRLPEWAGIPLAAIPLVLLIAWCVWLWREKRSG
jgi:hypothetical protein